MERNDPKCQCVSSRLEGGRDPTGTADVHVRRCALFSGVALLASNCDTEISWSPRGLRWRLVCGLILGKVREGVSR